MELEAQGFHRVRIWTRGVDTARFSPTKFSPEWRRRLSGGEPEKPLLLYVGRVSVEKRLAWLHSVLSTIPGLRLAIVGDGPDRARLENLFAGLPVVFTGYLRGEELAHAYASADIFVFPAANETLGNVVLEAMSSGLVVVAANSGGPRDLINHRANGLLFTPESRGDLVRVIRDLLAIPGWMNQLRTAARAEALTRSWEVVFDALLEEYAMLADFATQHPWREIGFYRREGWKARYKGAGLKDHSALY
jgi:glycosyltransferase involved in cell wall biosynthesis